MSDGPKKKNSITPTDVSRISKDQLRKMGRAQFERVLTEYVQLAHDDRRENQLLYYQPVSKQALSVHQSTATTIGLFGGNRSSKTTTPLAEIAAAVTGVVPYSLRNVGIDWSKRLRGPIQARIVCANKNLTMYEVILRKYQWYEWTGVPGSQKGGDKGHYGLIPRNCLIDGDWDKSWSDKRSTLTVLYRNPDNPDQVMGRSSIQFMSSEQDSKQHESGDVSIILLDEPPPLSIFLANQARVMSCNGRIYLAMTWPDRPEVSVDWVYDKILEPGSPGPKRNPEVECFQLHTTQNPTIDQDSVRRAMGKMSDKEIQTRIYGNHVRYANRIHPLFTDTEVWFCYQCGDERNVTDDGKCYQCAGSEGVKLCHVQEFDYDPAWPVLWVVDPHPRKAHMSIYVAVTPQDRLFQVADLDCEGDVADMAERCAKIEQEFGLNVRERMIDPRMGGSNCGPTRNHTWQDEFDAVGLFCDMADPSDVGRERVNTLLRPNPDTGETGIVVHPRCGPTIYQMTRFRWDDYRLDSERGMKQKPKDQDDDKPACWRYLANRDPRYSELISRPRGLSACAKYRPNSQRSKNNRMPRSFR